MKKLFIFLLSALSIAGCHDSQPHMRKFDPQKIFSIEDAQLILGDRANGLQGSTSVSPGGLASHKAKFEALSTDSATGKKGTLVFAYDEFASVADAQNQYAAIKKTDENSKGVKVLTDVGDEAYFNSDDSTFYYLLARTTNKTFQMNLTPITKTASRDEFLNTAKKVAKRIVDSLSVK